MDTSLIDDCVHCGFCLPTCPTYELWHEEMDSPRGRIWLMRATLDGTLELNQTVAEHFDRCLGCMACLTSCPSGVQYDRLIELARERVEQEVPRPLSATACCGRSSSPSSRKPKRLRLALRFSCAARARPVQAAQGARARAGARPVAPPAETPAVGTPIARVGLLTGCVQSVLFGEVNRASARVLAAYGYEVAAPYGGCCGALALHAGRREQGLELARRTAAALRRGRRGDDRHQRRRLRLPPEGRAPRPAGRRHLRGAHPRATRPSCTRSRTASRSRSRATSATPSGCATSRARCCARSPGVELVEPAEQELCCGSAGIYNLVQPEAARTLGDRKAANVLATEPDLYVSANPGCLLQVSAALRRAGQPIPAAHPVELLDASIRGVAPPTAHLDSGSWTSRSPVAATAAVCGSR